MLGQCYVALSMSDHALASHTVISEIVLQTHVSDLFLINHHYGTLGCSSIPDNIPAFADTHKSVQE